MSTQALARPAAPTAISRRADALALRLEAGVRALAEFAGSLSESQWQLRVPHDGRTVGVVVHHVASVFPIEIQLAQTLAAGKPIEGVTMADVHAMNAAHAEANAAVTTEAAVALLRQNAAVAAAAIRALGDAELDRAAPASLYGGAPLTCQFLLEDHAVRHSYHHLAILRATVAA